MGFFAKFVDKERLHLKGNRRSYTGNFIKNGLHGLLVNEEIDIMELEDLLNIVADLDPIILQQLNPILWRRWVQGELISVMIKMCSYFNKLQSSKKLFNQIFNLDLTSDCSNDLHEFFVQPFSALTDNWLPSALISDLDFLTQTALNVLKDPRLVGGSHGGSASKVYMVINIFLIAIGFELDAFDLDHLNLSVQDEKDLLRILDQISKILEGYEKVSKYWLVMTSKFWKIEKRRRLFLNPEVKNQEYPAEFYGEFLSPIIVKKLAKYSDVKMFGEMGSLALFEISLFQLEWQVLSSTYENQGKPEKYAKRFCKVVLQLFGPESFVKISPDCQRIMHEIIPDGIFFTARKPIVRVLCHLCLHGPKNGVYVGMELVEENIQIFRSVLKMVFETEDYSDLIKSLPLAYLPVEDIQSYFPKIKPQIDNLDLIFGIFTAINPMAMTGLIPVVESLDIDFDFYHDLRKLVTETNVSEKFAHTKDLIKIVARAMISAEADKLGPILTEIEEMDEFPEAQLFTHEWLMLLLSEIQKSNLEARTFGYKIADRILNYKNPKLFWNQSDAVHILLTCVRLDQKENEKFEISENRVELLTEFYNRLVIKLALVEKHENVDYKKLNISLSRVFTLFGAEAESKAFQLIKNSEISNLTISACWNVFRENLIEMRIKTVPPQRYGVELKLALEAIDKKCGEKSDAKVQAEHLNRIFKILQKTNDFWLRYETARKFLELKNLTKSNILIRSVLAFLVETPREGEINVIKAIYTILNDLCVQYSGKIVILAPAIIGVLKHFLELTEKLPKEKEVALLYYKRLVMFIKTNNDLKLKIGISLGFLFPLLAKLHIIFPDGGLVEEILFFHFDILSEKQVLSFSAQLNESHKKRISNCYDAWRKIKGQTKRFMTV